MRTAESLQFMINGKSPGSDGYTVDFYKFFWKDIGPFVFRSLFYGYNSAKFSEFQYQSVITCIPKEGKDRQYIGNWRPISLLNTDIKIASAALANRLTPVLPFIITRLVIGTSRTVGSAKKFVRITSGFGGGEFTKTLRKVCTCQKLKFSFLLLEYCKNQRMLCCGECFHD